jgi:hypothetical protein
VTAGSRGLLELACRPEVEQGRGVSGREWGGLSAPWRMRRRDDGAYDWRTHVRLLPEDLDQLRSRFSDFFDGVVCSVRLNVRARPRTCEVAIQAKDEQSASGWSNVRFTVRDVSEFRFQLGKSTFEVLSGGLQFGWQGESICLVFDAFPDDGPDLPDLSANIAYVIGASCEIDISPVS